MSKLTKEQLQGMSDIQILRKLYELLGFEVHEYVFEEVITIRRGEKVTTAELSPNDIMPLAFEYGISMLDFGGETVAFSKFRHVDVTSYDLKQGLDLEIAADYVFISKNPLRAIACCLILVLQEKP